MDFAKYSEAGGSVWARGKSVRTPAYIAGAADARSIHVRYDGAGLPYNADCPVFAGFVPLPRSYPRAVNVFGASQVAVSVGESSLALTAGLPAADIPGGYPWPFVWDGMSSSVIASGFTSPNPPGLLSERLPRVCSLDGSLSWFTGDGRLLGLPAAATSSTVSLKSDYLTDGDSVSCFCYCPNAEMTYCTYPVPTDCAAALYTIFASPCIFFNSKRYDEVKSVEIATLGDNVYALVTFATRLYNNIL